MNLQEEIESRVGPAPTAPSEFRFLGFNFNQAAEQDYARKRQLYDAAVQEAARVLVPQVFNPMRDATLGQISNFGGYRPEDIATPDQFRERTIEQPSLVPKTAMHYTREGDRPMAQVLEPEVVQPQGPGLPQARNVMDVDPFIRRMQSPEMNYRGTGDRLIQREAQERGPNMYQEGPQPSPVTMLRPRMIDLQGPPNPAGPEFYQRQGDPLQTTVREPNLEAPSTREQQMLGVSALKREGTWPRSSGGTGAASDEARIQMLMRAVNPMTGQPFTYDEAAMIVLGKEYVPGGYRASNIDARTNSSEARARNLDANTDYTLNRNQNYQREADDKHLDTESRINARDTGVEQRERLIRIKEGLVDVERRAKEAGIDQANLGWARLQELQKQHEFIRDWVMRQKGDFNPETKELLDEKLADMVGIEGEVGKQSLFQKLFGDKPQVRSKGQASPAQPGQQATPNAGNTKSATSSDVSSAIDNLLKSKGIDPAKAQREGVVFQGKTYKYVNGKWSE